jgi:tRNA G18 (ribose-2'-O)-methylase SpoU
MKFPKIPNDALGRLDVAQYKAAPKTPLIIVLDNIRSHNNVGSVFRTADAFRAQAVYLCGFTDQPPHRDIHKTALGATESVDWQYFETTAQAVESLKNDGYQVWAIEQAEGRTMLHELQLTPGGKHAIIFGNEVSGVDDEVMALVDGVVEIPQFGTKHSLNISVSAGIVIWEFWKGIGPQSTDDGPQ